MRKLIRCGKQQKLSFDPFLLRGKKMSFDLRVIEMSYESNIFISTSLIAHVRSALRLFILFFLGLHVLSYLFKTNDFSYLNSNTSK